MSEPVADLENVTSAILHEIQGVMGLAGHRRLARLVGSLFQPSARHLPSIAPHFIPISADPYRRMAAVRAALQQLLDGKALLIFPRGDVEIDPALSPQAVEGISRWSPSLELFLRRAPRASLVIATVAGVLSARWFNHPILRLWKKNRTASKSGRNHPGSRAVDPFKETATYPTGLLLSSAYFLRSRPDVRTSRPVDAGSDPDSAVSNGGPQRPSFWLDSKKESNER